MTDLLLPKGCRCQLAPPQSVELTYRICSAFMGGGCLTRHQPSSVELYSTWSSLVRLNEGGEVIDMSKRIFVISRRVPFAAGKEIL